jgi:hypothetical protein
MNNLKTITRMLDEKMAHLEKAKDTHEASEGTRIHGDSMSYDIGYYEGQIALLKRMESSLRSRKPKKTAAWILVVDRMKKGTLQCQS